MKRTQYCMMMSWEKGDWKETAELFVGSRSLCTLDGQLSGYRKTNRWTQLRIMSYSHCRGSTFLSRSSLFSTKKVQKHPDTIRNIVLEEIINSTGRFPLLCTWQIGTCCFPLAVILAQLIWEKIRASKRKCHLITKSQGHYCANSINNWSAGNL